MLIPDASKSLQECNRMLTPGGLLGVTTWQAVGWYTEVSEALSTAGGFPSIPPHDKWIEGFNKQSWHTPELAKQHLEDDGFVDVTTVSVPGKTRLESVDEAVSIFPGMLGVMMKVLWSEKDMKARGKDAMRAVEEFLRKKHGDGPVEWDWTAVVGWGRKPE
jgi:hypothetical protein